MSESLGEPLVSPAFEVPPGSWLARQRVAGEEMPFQQALQAGHWTAAHSLVKNLPDGAPQRGAFGAVIAREIHPDYSRVPPGRAAELLALAEEVAPASLPVQAVRARLMMDAGDAAGGLEKLDALLQSSQDGSVPAVMETRYQALLAQRNFPAARAVLEAGPSSMADVPDRLWLPYAQTWHKAQNWRK